MGRLPRACLLLALAFLTLEAPAADAREVRVGVYDNPPKLLLGKDGFGVEIDVTDYTEHAMGAGSDARAAAYVECRTADGKSLFGCGLDTDVATASVRAILSAANGA